MVLLVLKTYLQLQKDNVVAQGLATTMKQHLELGIRMK